MNKSTSPKKLLHVCCESVDVVAHVYFLSLTNTMNRNNHLKRPYLKVTRKGKVGQNNESRLMSSEESDVEEDREILMHHTIPWLSATIKNFSTPDLIKKLLKEKALRPSVKGKVE